MINTKSKYQFFFEFLSFTLNYKLPLFFILIIGSLLSALINYQKSTIYKLNFESNVLNKNLKSSEQQPIP